MKASELDWSKIHRLAPNEWPAGVLQQMDARVILRLSDVRKSVPADHSCHPSPLPGAHVRTTGTSRHSIEGGRLSDATDFFVSWAHLWRWFAEAQRNPQIGGIGLYLDTHRNHVSTPMMHIDCREERLMWVRVAGEYISYQKEPLRFLAVLAKFGKEA